MFKHSPAHPVLFNPTEALSAQQEEMAMEMIIAMVMGMETEIMAILLAVHVLPESISATS